MRMEHTIEIDRPVDAVFAFVADPRNDERWCPRVRSCRQVAGDGPGPGARYEVFHNPTLQRPHVRHVEIVDLEPPTRVVSIQDDAVARFEIAYLLEPAGGGTRLTQRDDIDWKISRLAQQIGRRVVNRHLGDQLRRLKRLLEQAPHPGG